MTDPVPDSNPSTRWLWVALIVLLAVAAVAVFLNPTGDAEEEAAEIATETDDTGSSLIVTEPTPGAPPVDLPDTPVTPVPLEDTTAAEANPGTSPAQ